MRLKENHPGVGAQGPFLLTYTDMPCIPVGPLDLVKGVSHLRLSLEAAFMAGSRPVHGPVPSKNCPHWFHILLPLHSVTFPYTLLPLGTGTCPTLSQGSSASLGSWLLCQSPLSGCSPPSQPLGMALPYTFLSSLSSPWLCAHPSALSQELSLQALTLEEASKSQAGSPPTGSASLMDGGPEIARGSVLAC